MHNQQQDAVVGVAVAVAVAVGVVVVVDSVVVVVSDLAMAAYYGSCYRYDTDILDGC